MIPPGINATRYYEGTKPDKALWLAAERRSVHPTFDDTGFK